MAMTMIAKRKKKREKNHKRRRLPCITVAHQFLLYLYLTMNSLNEQNEKKTKRNNRFTEINDGKPTGSNSQQTTRKKKIVKQKTFKMWNRDVK